ncbi:MAG: hypothetical protein KC420_00265 [Myxococcales bacterium]|nr:hypothetical protein [Myxococcales bacterium]MCB9567504.1 hypothetical protein [Myxococcales bacterium]MCB9700625.1 hypothetical protein [Myxococcales bacterium]
MTMISMSKKWLAQLSAVAALAAGAGADGGGCAAFSQSDAPDMEGAWALSYGDDLAVEIKIGGAVYEATIGVEGGVIEIEHDGQPFTFDLDCAKEEVICPSEAWPAMVRMTQPNAKHLHQVHVTLPGQECMGELVTADPATCGEGTENPKCDDICDGEVLVGERDVLGIIDEPGESFDILLGAGVASNGVNCALLGVSSAHAEIESQQRPEWRATALSNGEVVVAYSGGCLWAGDVDMNGEPEALVLGATLTFRTSFEATRS